MYIIKFKWKMNHENIIEFKCIIIKIILEKQIY